MKIYEVSFGNMEDYTVLCITDDYERAIAKLAEEVSDAGRWTDEYSITVWVDGVHSDEYFGMRACDNGWECHHYYDGKDEAIWSVSITNTDIVMIDTVVEAMLNVPVEPGEVVTMDMIVASADEARDNKKPFGVVFL